VEKARGVNADFIPYFSPRIVKGGASEAAENASFPAIGAKLWSVAARCRFPPPGQLGGWGLCTCKQDVKYGEL
jgi:hypothetical protein